MKSDSSLAGKVFDEVNSYRVSKGKAALQRHSGLDRLAQQHCEYLARTAGRYDLYGRNISHIGFDGRATSARHFYKIMSLGENVVSSMNHSEKYLVKLWIKSESHERTMTSDWYCSGIGTAVTSHGALISTQLFGTYPSDNALDQKLRFNRN